MGLFNYLTGKTKKPKKSDLPFQFIEYKGSDEVCQITAAFQLGVLLELCQHCGLLKYKNVSEAGVKSDDTVRSKFLVELKNFGSAQKFGFFFRDFQVNFRPKNRKFHNFPIKRTAAR